MKGLFTCFTCLAIIAVANVAEDPLCLAFMVETWPVLESLQRCQVDYHYIEVLRCLYDATTMSVQVQGQKSKPIQLRTGVRQGDVISPKLFTSALEDVSKTLDWKGLLAPGLRIKYDISKGTEDTGVAGTDYFFHLPLTVSDAKADGWRETPRSPGPIPQLVMFCPQDKKVCPLYDNDTGYVAGLSVALHGFNNHFDWKQSGFRQWNTAINGTCVTQYVTEQFFVSEEYLQQSVEDRIANYDSSRILQEKALWVTGFEGELLKISASEKRIKEQNLFKKQSCMPWMGQHYFYKITTETTCDRENLFPWFVMTMDGEVTASGLLLFGNMPIDKCRDWFERPDLTTAKMIVPYGPQCVYDLATDPGILTMHIYYVGEPKNITCN